MNKPACQESSIFLSEIRDTSLTSSTLKDHTMMRRAAIFLDSSRRLSRRCSFLIT